MKKILLILFLCFPILAKSENKLEFIIPKIKNIESCVSTFDLGASYLKTNCNDKFVFSFDITVMSFYFSYGSNYRSSPEIVYGEGYLTDNYLLESFKFGFSFLTNKNIYITPFLGACSRRQLYSDQEYGENVFGYSKSVFNAGLNIGYLYKGLDIKYVCGVYEQGISIGLNLMNMIKNNSN